MSEKLWCISYSIINADGYKEFGDDFYVKARLIYDAIRLADDCLYCQMDTQHWQAFKIWNISMCDDNVWDGD